MLLSLYPEFFYLMGCFKKICLPIGIVLTFYSGYSQSNSEIFFSSVNHFFNHFVNEGLVNYSAIYSDGKTLDSLAIQIKNMPIEAFSENEKKSLLINAYNILAIKNVIDRYPVKSPMDIAGFYDGIRHTVGRKNLTLDEIENKELRPVYKDARFHFVLVCGAMGCPPITNFAYLPDKLEQQMETQVKIALNNNNFIKVNGADKKVLLSEIFKWYEADFKQKGLGIIGFINQYRDNKIPEGYQLDYYPYDWSLNEFTNNTGHVFNPAKNISNVQAYTPSVLLKKNQFAIQFFNNLYTQTAYRNNKKELIDLHERASYYGGLLQFNYGISESSRINVGADINLKSARIDTSESKSVFNLFRFENTVYQRTALASLGPKIKISPFKRQIHFSIQSAFWIPVAKDLEADTTKKPWLDYNRYTWWNQFFFDKSVGKKFQIFIEADLLFRFAKDSTKYAFSKKKTSSLSTPVSFFLSYFPTKKSTVYGMIQYAPTFESIRPDNNGAPTKYYYVSSFYSQFGFGGKYQLAKQLSVELLYTNFFASMNGGAGVTYNLGIKYLR